ncbi:MAG TPA: phospholipase D-like domain-containing protein [Alphaproteobacteria bacterium]
MCFRPGPEPCEPKIVAAIDNARSSLLVQAYGFTDRGIISAIDRAHARDLPVRVLLDKENRSSRYGGLADLQDHDVPVRIDDRVAIAHNKVIVIDGERVIGGSYNYSSAAEKKNAENVTLIDSACVADAFTENFDARWAASAPVAGIARDAERSDRRSR